jgi:hypothetical protein
VVVVGSMVRERGMAKRRHNGSGREFNLRVGFRKRVRGMPSSLGQWGLSNRV